MWDSIYQLVIDKTDRIYTHISLKSQLVHDDPDFHIVPKSGGELALGALYACVPKGNNEDEWKVSDDVAEKAIAIIEGNKWDLEMMR